MNTAIIYASKHGTTTKAAKKIAAQISTGTVEVFNLKTDQSIDLEKFDTVILGTAIYAGAGNEEILRRPKRAVAVKMFGFVRMQHGTERGKAADGNSRRISPKFARKSLCNDLSRWRVPV